MPRTWSTGALIAAGLGAWIAGVVMGARIMADYVSAESGPQRNRRRLTRARRRYR